MWTNEVSVAAIEQVTPGPVDVGTEFNASETLPARLVSFARIAALEVPTRVTFYPIELLGQIMLLARLRRVPPENLKSLQRSKVILER